LHYHRKLSDILLTSMCTQFFQIMFISQAFHVISLQIQATLINNVQQQSYKWSLFPKVIYWPFFHQSDIQVAVKLIFLGVCHMVKVRAAEVEILNVTPM
jgi:hypothetical protein